MFGVLALIYIPIVLYVFAFLYETYCIYRIGAGKQEATYVETTWEITHTLLVFGVVMMVMQFTPSLDKLSDALTPLILLTAVLLVVRSALYVVLLYTEARVTKKLLSYGLLAFHGVLAVLLLTIVGIFTMMVARGELTAHTQFVAPFLPGLALVLIVNAIPLFMLYTQAGQRKR